MAQSMLEAALAYVAQGFKVFPVKPDKRPLTEHGLKDATFNVETVKSWWQKWPNAGIAIPTEGLIVPDFDQDHDGLKSKATLEEKHGALPPTRTHRTGGGGLHLLYRNPNGSDIRNTVGLDGLPGVDLRANGGYIVVPPSFHESGNRYEVQDPSEIAFCPDWLMTLAKARPPVNSSPAGDAITEGRRHHRLISIAGSLRRQGLNQEAIESALREINLKQCNPPLPDTDISKLAKTAAGYPSGNLDILDKLDKSDILDKSDNSDNLDRTDNLDSARPGREVRKSVDRWLTLHQGEEFDLDTICRQLNISAVERRHDVVKKLAYEVTTGKLEKSKKMYRYLSTIVQYIDWVHASTTTTIRLNWPRGRLDGTGFGFVGRVVVSPGDIIVLAGVSNAGKTSFCLNLLFENLEVIPCVLMGNEYQANKFRRRVEHMTWANPIDEATGLPKFELIKRYDNWKDVIRPDALNIIDWINLADNFWSIGAIIEGIQSKLHDGVAVISLQKSEVKTLGRGGDFSRDLSSIYLAIDPGRLTVVKCKEWQEVYPQGKTYSFELTQAGTVFGKIHEIAKCKPCWGSGKLRGGTCGICDGTGYVPVKE